MAEVVVPLTVRDLTEADLPACDWYGNATALAAVADAIERARRGEVDYLAVCTPSGLPVAVGGVDYTKPLGGATIWQLSVQAELRTCGIGSVLIEALEQRARDRGLTWVELGVDDNRSRPRVVRATGLRGERHRTRRMGRADPGRIRHPLRNPDHPAPQATDLEPSGSSDRATAVGGGDKKRWPETCCALSTATSSCPQPSQADRPVVSGFFDVFRLIWVGGQ
jgi:GNAT superfamily N-acetyltransferase